MKPTQTTRLSLLAAAAMIPVVSQAAQIEVNATQTVNTTPLGPNVDAITADTVWTKDNIYILRDKVFITNGATLTIEPGTRIYSTLDDKGTSGKDDDEFGSLAITRGSKIDARGTAAEPIVFSTTDELEALSQTDIDGDGFVADMPTFATAGRWGGVVILGSAPIASYSGATNTNENRIEGFQPAASADLDTDGRADVIEYGGTSPADDSGFFRYVSIRHGGYVYDASTGSEINGLTLGGVGSGTTIDHVEVYANADDGIEFFGGTVNTSHIVLAFNQDDGFDIDEGYVGTNQFWFGIQTPTLDDGVSSGHDNGGEWDGVTGTIGDYATNSAPVIYNATFIGSGTTALAGNDKGNNAIYIDDRFKGQVYNSVFDDFSEHLIESASDGVGTGLTFAHNTVGRFGGGTPGNNLSYYNATNAPVGTFFDAAGTPVNGNSAGGTDPLYTAYSRNAALELVAIDPRPQAGSPLLAANGASLQPGAPVATDFRGAFGTTNWAAGWTKFDEAGFFSPKIEVNATQTVNTTPFGPNVDAITADTLWTKDNIYILRDKVFITNGATLTIEPGTRIYSTLDDKGTSGKDDDEFGSLAITRGSKIDARGTAAEPIVFSTTDELEALSQTDIDGDGFVADMPTFATAGRWGGVVILGSAPIASYSGATNTNENRIEGFQPAASADLDTDGRADVIEYGGTSPADDSGFFRYVSIRHGGYVYDASTGSEINGLTLGGVGSGTTIDHVEVYANADDGIEFFGGTVNTSHIVLAFNQDDGFDIDEGYVGTNQFWFGIQTPALDDGVSSGHDNGGEWDGVTGTIGDYATNSAPVIYNATFIGSGTTALAGNDKGNNAIYIDDRFKGQVYNSLFDDFSEHLIESASDGVGTGLTFAHNTVGRFGGGTPGNNLSYYNATNAPVGTFFDAAGTPVNGNSAGGTDPLYTAYSRNAALELVAIDPRPQAGSPLLAANGASLQPGAPVATDFRGAFGTTNWAAGWTKMSMEGLLLGEASEQPQPLPAFVDTDSDGLSDFLEDLLVEHGFDKNVSQSALVSQFYANEGFYTESSIQDLRGTGVMIQKTGDTVNLTLPILKSNTLGNDFVPAGEMTGTIEATADKEFYRLQIDGVE